MALASSCKKSNDEPQPEEQMPVTTGKPYISQIFEFNPAPGQFVSAELASPTAVKGLVGGINTLVSLGGYGGNIVFGFDHAVANGEGADLAIYGNPLTGASPWSEPGIVCVMQDKNGNGKPDDGEWLELAGSEYSKPTTVKNYQITYYKPATDDDDVKWTDNQGRTGYILKNVYHSQNYYPYTNATVTFSGTLLATTFKVGDILTSEPFEFGYVDNGSADFIAKGYNEFNIDWAVDKNGNKVDLKYINFVKVYTGQNFNGNAGSIVPGDGRERMMGEISTEITGAKDLHIN